MMIKITLKADNQYYDEIEKVNNECADLILKRELLSTCICSVIISYKNDWAFDEIIF